MSSVADWSPADQEKFEVALRTHPKTDAKRWDNIAADVGKSRADCVARFKFLAEQLKAGKVVAAPATAAAAPAKAEEPKAAPKAEEPKAAAEEPADGEGDGEDDDEKEKAKSVTGVGKQKKPSNRKVAARAKKAGKKGKGKGKDDKKPAKGKGKGDDDDDEAGSGDDKEKADKEDGGDDKWVSGGDDDDSAAKKGKTDAKSKPAASAKPASSAAPAAAKADSKSAAKGDSKTAAKDSKSKDSKSEAKGKEKDSYRICTGVLSSRPMAKDVKVINFSLQAYGRELIKDTELEFTLGRRYGLLGANGSGKSTLLRALAAREVPIPQHIDIFYLEEEAPPSEETALSYVVGQAKKEVARLEKLADKVMDEEGPDSEVLQEIYDKIESFDPKMFETKASKLLFGLGFTPKDLAEKKTKDMSGGWRMRVALAQALFVRPALLLLDEPTNHLDLNACVWLEQYLSAYDQCLVVISHSQDFLNGVCTNIIHITPKGKLQLYTGNYDTFVKTKAENEVNQMKRYKKEQDDIKHIKAFIASCGTYSNLVRQAKSKQKILDKMEAAGLAEPVERDHLFKFTFPACSKLPPPVLAFHDVAFSYSGTMTKGVLYRGLNLGVDMDSRVALVGPNGAGKSTLLKLMADELKATDGQIKRHPDLRIARYHQHSNDQLDPTLTTLEYMAKTFPEMKLEYEQWRAHVGRFGIKGRDQTTKIGELSDGQKSRIVFCVLATIKPNLLLFDEPTNHLDMDVIDSLGEAIRSFEGGMVLVSHDFRLISQCAKEIWLCDHNDVAPWKGDIRSYKQYLVKEMNKQLSSSTMLSKDGGVGSGPTKK